MVCRCIDKCRNAAGVFHLLFLVISLLDLRRLQLVAASKKPFSVCYFFTREVISLDIILHNTNTAHAFDNVKKHGRNSNCTKLSPCTLSTHKNNACIKKRDVSRMGANKIKPALNEFSLGNKNSPTLPAHTLPRGETAKMGSKAQDDGEHGSRRRTSLFPGDALFSCEGFTA